jgi:hypothetical protein
LGGSSVKTRLAFFSVTLLLFALLLWPGISWHGRWGYVVSGVYQLTQEQAALAKASYRDRLAFYFSRSGDGSCRFGTLLKLCHVRYMFDAYFDPTNRGQNHLF